VETEKVNISAALLEVRAAPVVILNRMLQLKHPEQLQTDYTAKSEPNRKEFAPAIPSAYSPSDRAMFPDLTDTSYRASDRPAFN
jgi:hypothetical protein